MWFARNEGTGALTYLGRYTNSLIDDAVSVVVSPDGKHVYVAAWIADAVAWFSRNTDTGSPDFGNLTYLDRYQSSTTIDTPRCVAISPDGEHVYIGASTGGFPGGSTGTLAWFDRDPASGALTYGDKDTRTGTAGICSLAFSPTGTHVYATAQDIASVAWFSRDAGTGAATYGDRHYDISTLVTAQSVAVSPDGLNAYVAAGGSDAVAWFGRDSTSGDVAPSCFGSGGDITYLDWLLSAWGWTLSVSLLALLVALLLGSIMGILRTAPHRGWVLLGNAWTELFRNIPLLVQIFLWYHVLPALVPPLKEFPSFILVVFALGFFTSARIAEQVADYLLRGSVTNAVNVPSVSADVLAQVGPYITLGEMLGSLHMQMAKGGVQTVNIEYSGQLADLNTAPVTVAFLKGLFTPILQDAVNFVNAPVIAKDRGIRVVESKSEKAHDFNNVLSVKVVTTEGENILVGTVFGKNEPRLVRLNSFRLEALPSGPMLLVYNKDVPGVIGALGTTLGKAGVNISRMTVGREEASNQNIIFLSTDELISRELLARVRELEHIDDAVVLELNRF